MNLNTAIADKLTKGHSPYVARLADRFAKSADTGVMEINDLSWHLIEEVFGFAAEAEAQLMEQEERIDHLEELCTTDELTRLSNRRGLEAFLDKAISRARRHGNRGIVGFFDLDWFKDINDRLGHKAGDLALAHVGGILAENIRGCDLAARSGGDEFVVVLDSAVPDMGIKRLETIASLINKTVFKYEGVPVRIHVSLGIATFSASSKPADVLAEADQAMYANKDGRKKNSTKLAY